jgi:hypothetical protein
MSQMHEHAHGADQRHRPGARAPFLMQTKEDPVTAHTQRSRGRMAALGGLGFVVLFMLGAIVSNVATTATYPRPEADASTVQAYFADNAGVVAFLSITQAAAALLLVLFAGGVAAVARRWDGEPSWEADGAALGGALAAAFLLLAGLLAWTLSRDQLVDNPGGMVALHQLAFAAGGAGHVAPLGLLVGASSLVALRRGFHGRWLAVVGLVAAALSLMSLATFAVLDMLVVLIPVGRFSSFFYIIAASVLLLSGRLASTEPTPTAATTTQR